MVFDKSPRRGGGLFPAQIRREHLGGATSPGGRSRTMTGWELCSESTNCRTSKALESSHARNRAFNTQGRIELRARRSAAATRRRSTDTWAYRKMFLQFVAFRRRDSIFGAAGHDKAAGEQFRQLWRAGRPRRFRREADHGRRMPNRVFVWASIPVAKSCPSRKASVARVVL